jgi:hypothetical protein
MKSEDTRSIARKVFLGELFTTLIALTVTIQSRAESNTVRSWDDRTDVPDTVKNVRAISAGWEHTLAIASDGSLLDWGSDSATPPSGLTNVIAVAAGKRVKPEVGPDSAPDLDPLILPGALPSSCAYHLQDWTLGNPERSLFRPESSRRIQTKMSKPVPAPAQGGDHSKKSFVDPQPLTPNLKTFSFRILPFLKLH